MEVCVGVKGRGESVCEILSSIEWFIIIIVKLGMCLVRGRRS